MSLVHDADQEIQKSDAPIRVAVLDSRRFQAEALGRAVAEAAGYELIGVATTPWEAREVLRQRVDVALTSLAECRPDNRQISLDVVRELLAGHPDVRVLLLHDHGDQATLEELLFLGVSGFVPASSSVDDLLDSVRLAHRSQMSISTSTLMEMMHSWKESAASAREAAKQPEILTTREREVVSLMASGLDTRQMAEALVVSINTVRSHSQRSLTKLGVRSRLHAVARARELGLIEAQPVLA